MGHRDDDDSPGVLGVRPSASLDPDRTRAARRDLAARRPATPLDQPGNRGAYLGVDAALDDYDHIEPDGSVCDGGSDCDLPESHGPAEYRTTPSL